MNTKDICGLMLQLRKIKILSLNVCGIQKIYVGWSFQFIVPIGNINKDLSLDVWDDIRSSNRSMTLMRSPQPL